MYPKSILDNGLNIFLLLFIILASLPHYSDTRRTASKVVTTKYGRLRGYTINFSNKNLQPVEVFLGIPYASAPVGSLRFMPPVTPSHWAGTRIADQFGAVCPQKLPKIKNETEALQRMPAGRLAYLKRLFPYLVNQSEDCLYLNIYTPAQVDKNNPKVPVMVYIHGESYEWNSGNPYDGSVLASFGNIVVVTINFRLGVIGFLPAVDGSSRGNYGLMDQVAALHWIQENIEEFGGDPTNVTIFGQGYGAACINLLMFSQMAKGLFQRVIMQSGSALSSWAIAREALTYSKHLAITLGCPYQKSAALLDCMRQRSIEEIMKVDIPVPDHLTAFGPTIDNIVIPGEPEMLMAHSSETFGQYELLFGVTRIESYHLFSGTEEKAGIEPRRRDRLLRTLVRNLYSFHLEEIFLTIVNEYTDWTRPVQHPINILDGTADALGDALVVAPILRTGNFHSVVQAKTFFYVFTYQTEVGDYSERLGCIHGEDLAYIFGAPLVSNLAHFTNNFSRSETSLSEAVMTFWTNFAKVGDPNIPNIEIENEKSKGRFEKFTWPEYGKIQQKYLSIGMKPKVRDHYHAHRLSFWLNLIPSLHRATETERGDDDHHLLDDHHNPMTYDGVVRLHPLPDSTPASVPTPKTYDDVLIPNQARYRTPPSGASTTVETSTDFSTEFSSTVNSTDALSLMMQQTIYSTALSVTIAIGCSLLILNVLIFAGVYYQRDKNNKEIINKREFQLLRAGDLQNTQLRLQYPDPKKQ